MNQKFQHLEKHTEEITKEIVCLSRNLTLAGPAGSQLPRGPPLPLSSVSMGLTVRGQSTTVP